MSKRITSILVLLAVSILYADDGFDEEDGFVDEEIIEVVKTKSEIKNAHSLSGSITFSTSYNYKHTQPSSAVQNDFRDFSSAKITSDIKYDYDIDDNYKIKSVLKLYKDFIYDIKESEYKTVPEDYDKDFNINELYLQGKLSQDTDIKTGRQIVVWGKSDNIRITDTLNPLNNTTPGMVDIKDLRLGSFMTKIDHFIDQWSISGIIIHENRFSSMPKYGSDFASANRSIADATTVVEPSNSIKNNCIALSVKADLTGEDIAFYYSNKFIDNTTYRSNMAGIAYNKVIDSFLLKAESAYFDNYDSNSIDKKLDALIGVEYNGIKEGSISLEAANKDQDIQYALRFNQSYLNQTLDLTVLVNMHGKELEKGGLVRVWFEYDIDDSFQTTFGIVDYKGGKKPNFEMIKDNDRVFASLKYSF